MKKYILLMLLISCQEEETLKRRNPFMTISNALPVQFWINGVETFNESSICGVEDVCFCQPFNCDDEIRIQFQDTSIDYVLKVYDIDGNELEEIAFIEVASGVFQIDFIPQNYGICDEKIQLKIVTNALYAFNTGKWINYGTGVSWVLGVSTVTDSAPTTKEYVRPFYWQAGVTYTFTYQLTLSVSGGGYGSTDIFLAEDSSTTGVANHVDNDNYTTSGVKNGTFTITPTTTYFGFLRLFQQVNILGSPASSQCTLNSLSVSTSGDYTHAQSDCLDIKTSHDCTTLIEYLNTDDFSNIVYLTSPTSEFKLRVPAQFWKEDNPMEQEDSELSNGVIKTRRQSIQEKRYLELGFMPNYMHKKVQLVLMHDTITIAGDQWKRRDAYESESIRRYPLKRANVWLTKYNSISDNII